MFLRTTYYNAKLFTMDWDHSRRMKSTKNMQCSKTKFGASSVLRKTSWVLSKVGRKERGKKEQTNEWVNKWTKEQTNEYWVVRQVAVARKRLSCTAFICLPHPLCSLPCTSAVFLRPPSHFPLLASPKRTLETPGEEGGKANRRKHRQCSPLSRRSLWFAAWGKHPLHPRPDPTLYGQKLVKMASPIELLFKYQSIFMPPAIQWHHFWCTPEMI